MRNGRGRGLNRSLVAVVLMIISLLYVTNIFKADQPHQNRSRRERDRRRHVSFLHLIIQFPLLHNGSSTTNIDIQQRQHEYANTLERNLKHPLVQKIHIMCENDDVKKYIRKQFPEYALKIELVNLGKRLYYSDAFTYASTVLASKTCVIINADCFLGEGFENIDVKSLQSGTVYALTRHETATNMANCGLRNFCGKKSNYIGSHDAFIINVRETLPKRMLYKLNYQPNIIGGENFVILLLQKYGKFRVKNPCRIIRIYHNHCNKKRGVRLIHGKRLERFLKVPKGLAPFSGL